MLVEGGSFVLTQFIENNLADQVEVYVAPKIVGGRDALSPIEGLGRPSMQEAMPLVEVRTHRSGNDLWIQGFF
ncbi:MAG: dihydrofolate reductase family protein [Planctomycetota bacterium]